MSAPVVRTSGNAKSHVVHSGYRYQSAPHAKFVRPEGEPPLWKAVSLLAALVVIAVIGSAVLP